MARVLYPALQGPVEFQQISSKWQKPLSEPTRRIGLISAVVAAGCFFSNFVPAPAMATWHRPLSEPVRFRNIQTAEIPANFSPSWTDVVSQAQFPDRWESPLSLPTRAQFRRPTPTQISLSLSQFEPFSDGTRVEFYRPLSEPVRRRGFQAQHQNATAFVQTAPFAGGARIEFYVPLSEPVRRRGLQAQYQRATAFVQAEPFAAGAEVDFYVPLSEPPRTRGLLPVSDRPSSFFIPPSGFTGTGDGTTQPWPPFSEPQRAKFRQPIPWQRAFAYGVQPIATVSTDAWFGPFSRPVRYPLGIGVDKQDATFFVGAAPFGENVKTDALSAPLSYPQRYPRGLGTHQQDPIFFVGAAPFGADTSTVDRWWSPFSTPLRLAVPVARQQAFPKGFPPLAGAVTDTWLRALSQPVRVPRGVAHYLQDAIISSPGFAPFPEATTVGRWYARLSEPYLKKKYLPVSDYPATFFVKAAPFGETIFPDKYWVPFSDPVRLKRINVGVAPSIFVSPFGTESTSYFTMTGTCTVTFYSASILIAEPSLGTVNLIDVDGNEIPIAANLGVGSSLCVFQNDAFQNDAFQVCTPEAEPEPTPANLIHDPEFQ